MIPVHRWEVSVPSIATDFKIFKMLFSFSIFKKKQLRGGAFSYHSAIAKC
jgi:hypothetical protein